MSRLASSTRLTGLRFAHFDHSQPITTRSTDQDSELLAQDLDPRGVTRMRPVCLLLVALLLGTCLGKGAPESARTDPPPPAGAAAAKVADDEKAIAGLVAAFTKAFNAGDAAAAAATFAEDALVIDEHNGRTEGRAAIRAGLAASFAASPGSTIAIKVNSLRILGPDTALEEGKTTITPAGADESPEITHFTVVYIKKDGQWLQSAVRDEFSHDLSPHDRLKELEWLVGTGSTRAPMPS